MFGIKNLKLFLALFFFTILGCSKNINAYQDNIPKILMKDFYSKQLTGNGVVCDFFSKTKSSVVMTSVPGKIEDYTDARYPGLKLKKMYLHQTLKYLEDGKEKKFISYAIYNPEGTIFIYKDEMMLKEAEYKICGNTSNVKYDLTVERDNGSTVIVSADDWFYLVEEKVGINEIDISKFGINVGHITMTIRQDDSKDYKILTAK